MAVPRSNEVRVRVSEEIKGRESYRPVAPVIRAEDLTRFFDGRVMSPYMTYAYAAKAETMDRAPAIVHVDGTSRVQTVTSDQHPFSLCCPDGAGGTRRGTVARQHVDECGRFSHG